MSASPSFRRIGLLCNYLHPETPAFIPKLLDFLKQKQCDVVTIPTTKALLQQIDINTVESESLKDHCDLLIVIGGDGSLLRASTLALSNDLPILGINRGHLGFLTALPSHTIEKLSPILDGFYQIESRLVIDADIYQQDKIICTLQALNDIVITHYQATHMLEFDISLKDQKVCQVRADGYIIATPTGSTAYALSAGGPILEPQTNALALVPMFPHSLSSRPLVTNANNIIKIKLIGNHGEAIISADGHMQHSFNEDMICIIKKSDKKLKIVHSSDYQYFTNLSDKLSWHNSTKRG